MLNIRRPWDRLIFNMGIAVLVRWHLYIETAPWVPPRPSDHPGCGLFHGLLAQPPICLPFEGLSVEKSGNPHRSREPTILCDWGNPNLYLDQQVTKGWCQPITDLVSYPTDSPSATTATKLGLWSSLSCCTLACSKWRLLQVYIFSSPW